MADTYRNFAALAGREQLGLDYTIASRDSGTRVLAVAPHGGGIEPGTSEIVLAVAGADLSYYLFEGLKPGGNGVLHITSSNFDEPKCLALARSADLVITVHGEDSASATVFLGGAHDVGKAVLQKSLRNDGYAVERHSDELLQGLHSRNLCNLGKARAGVQIEISRGLRRKFFESLKRSGRRNPTAGFAQFCNVLRRALLQIPIG